MAALFPFYTNISYFTFPDLCEAEKDALLNQGWPPHQNKGRHSGSSTLRPVCIFAFPITTANLTAQQTFRSMSSINYVSILHCVLCISYKQSIYMTFRQTNFFKMQNIHIIKKLGKKKRKPTKTCS